MPDNEPDNEKQHDKNVQYILYVMFVSYFVKMLLRVDHCGSLAANEDLNKE